MLLAAAALLHLFPDRLVCVDVTTHTEHSLSQSSQLQVGIQESFFPEIIKWLLLPINHYGTAPVTGNMFSGTPAHKITSLYHYCCISEDEIQ